VKRKRRSGEVVCRCGAYRFPHRMMGGRCDGGAYVDKLFTNQMYGTCRDCNLREYVPEEGAMSCQVLQGLEPMVGCPELVAHISHEGIKLYGVNAPPKKGPLRFRR
jgi:hypothetical protein